MPNNSIKKCQNCESHHLKVTSWMSQEGRLLYFCSLKCKREWVDKKYPKIQAEEKKREEESKSVLPEVRTFIGRKEKDGTTTVRRYHGDQGQPGEAKDRGDRGASGPADKEQG